MSQDTQQGYPGQAGLSSATSELNKIHFLIRQVMGNIRTATVVRVEAVNGGGIGPIGTVDATPLVKKMDGLGNTFENGVIFELPYCRVQGGTNAIICDPQVGDVGVAVFADRDISVVKQSDGSEQSQPGSRRRFNYADGLYLFPVISQIPPLTFIQFTPAGIIIQAPTVNVIGVLQVNGVPVIVP